MIIKMKRFLKSISAVAVLSLALSGNAWAQLNNAGEILRAGTEDANAYLSEFLSPFANGFGAGLNTGWFTTANARKTLGFELNVSGSISTVPSSALSFNAPSLLDQLEVTQGSNTVPTISGSDVSNTRLGQFYTDPRDNTQKVLYEFDAPTGLNIEYVPTPMAQLTVGIIKDTDISLRFFPTTEISDFGELGLFGFGVKHGINQWLPGEKLIPVDLSVQFGYTSFNMSTNFDVNPQVNANTYDPYNTSQWTGQGLDLETTAYTANIIVGKTLPFISAFGGIGIEGSTTTLGTPGSYPITSPAGQDDYNQYPNEIYHPINNPNGATQIVRSVDAPIDIEMDGENNFRAFAGVRLKLAVIHLFANYTLSTYSTANAGFGFTFR